MNDLNDIKCFLLDMDGTIYLSDVLFKGALQAVERMQQKARVIFLTNNSSRTRAEYYDKLTRMGFKLSPADIYGSASATVDYLNARHKNKRVYLLGSDELKTEFSDSGIPLCEDNPSVAVIAFDKTLTYKKLEVFCRHLDNGAFFIATHPDNTCPTATGYIPDVGCFLKLIKCATGRLPDVICGKPSKEYGRRILSITGLKPKQIAMVGDRLTTDMRFAYNCGFKSVLVLTGETKKGDLLKIKKRPDIIIESISDWDCSLKLKIKNDL